MTADRRGDGTGDGEREAARRLPTVRAELTELPPWKDDTPSGRRAAAITSELTTALASRLGVAADELVVGRDRASLVAALASAFGVRRDRAPASAMAVTPTHKLYKWTVRSRGVRVVEVPLDPSFALDRAMLDRAIVSMKPQLVFLGAPNDPTGVPLTSSELDAILTATAALPDAPAMVVVDESAAPLDTSLRSHRHDHPHLAMLREVQLSGRTLAWVEIAPELAPELAKMPGFAPIDDQLARLVATEWEATSARENERREKAQALAARLAAIPNVQVTAGNAPFVWAEIPGDAAAAVKRAEARGAMGLGGGGVGRLARRVRVEWLSEEDVETIVDVLLAVDAS